MSREVDEVGGILRDQTDAERAAREAQLRGAAVHADRGGAATPGRARARRRPSGGSAESGEYGLWPLMQLVEQRLVELKAFLPELARRRALLPRVVALAQDVLDLGLSRDLRDRIHALHRTINSEPALVANAVVARRLLDDIEAYEFGRAPDENGILPADNTGLFKEWRRQLGWHVAPLPPVELASYTAQVEALVGEVLAAIRGKR
jgi:hypothetical protein